MRSLVADVEGGIQTLSSEEECFLGGLLDQLGKRHLAIKEKSRDQVNESNFMGETKSA